MPWISGGGCLISRDLILDTVYYFLEEGPRSRKIEKLVSNFIYRPDAHVKNKGTKFLMQLKTILIRGIIYTM